MLDSDQRFIIIPECNFKIDEDSDCLLFYSNEIKSSFVKLVDTTFSGNLPFGSLYIGCSGLNESINKLIFERCKFSDGFVNSINFKLNEKNLIFLNLKNKVLNDNSFCEKKSNKSRKVPIIFVSSIAVLGTIIPAVFLLRRNKRL